MSKKWKKWLAAVSAASMLLTLPGVSVLADELQEENVESVAEYPEEDTSGSEVPEEIEEDSQVVVGDGVTAEFDEQTGALQLFSEEGTLDKDWLAVSGIDNASIRSIRVASGTVYLPADSSHIFAEMHYLTSLDLSGFDTSNVTDMSKMFYNSFRLTRLDLSGFDTSNVTSMKEMFWQCYGLKELDLSSFNTSNVTSMNQMFYNCWSLTDLDLSSFNTSNVTDMGYMFRGCILEKLDLSSFNTSNVTNMQYMFSSCWSLTDLDLSSFNTSKVINMEQMFSECRALENLDLSNFNTSSVKIMGGMFNECGSLTKLDLSSFNTSKVYNMDYMFRRCTSLTELDLSSFDVDDATNGNLFTQCISLQLLKTPKRVSSRLFLPITMYDETGREYNDLYNLSESITLTNKRPGGITPTPTPTPAIEGFSDVQDPKHAYFKAIYWAANAGITKGYPDGTFGINKSCTRGEMMMFLWRYAGKRTPKAAAKSPFKDVPKNHAFYTAILWGSQVGITKGYADGTFGINKNVTRGECMMFLWRLYGTPDPSAVAKSPFKDVPKSHAFYKAILWGSQKKITTGYTSGEKKGTFGIKENCTRGQIVTFLYRAKSIK